MSKAKKLTKSTKKSTKPVKPKSGYDPNALRYLPIRLVAPSKPGGRWSCIKSKTKRVTSREYYACYMKLKRAALKTMLKTTAKPSKKTTSKKTVKTSKTSKTTKPSVKPTPSQKTTKPVQKPIKPKAWRVWVKCSPDLEDWSERARKAFINYLDKASRNPSLVPSMTPEEHDLYLKWTLGELL